MTKSSVRGDKILQAAGNLFARQGYHATTTRQVAQLADVGENTIFRRFDTKEGLFWATLEAQNAGLIPPKDLLDGLEQCKAPELVLPRILGFFEDTAEFRPKLLRLFAVASLELPGKMGPFCRRHLSPFLSMITEYFAVNIKSGKIRDLDPAKLTSALLMTAMAHPWIYSLIDGDKPSYSNLRMSRRADALFWLEVLVPKMLTDSTPSPSWGDEECGPVADSLAKVEHP
jgi:AcrR family transcriptional regulator